MLLNMSELNKIQPKKLDSSYRDRYRESKQIAEVPKIQGLGLIRNNDFQGEKK
jgi:hypothetical protein